MWCSETHFHWVHESSGIDDGSLPNGALPFVVHEQVRSSFVHDSFVHERFLQFSFLPFMMNRTNEKTRLLSFMFIVRSCLDERMFVRPSCENFTQTWPKWVGIGPTVLCCIWRQLTILLIERWAAWALAVATFQLLWSLHQNENISASGFLSVAWCFFLVAITFCKSSSCPYLVSR